MMYSNGLVPQQQQQQQQQGGSVGNPGMMGGGQQYHHQVTNNMHGFNPHNMGLDPSMMGVTKTEPTSLITPEIDKEKEKQARENHCEIERRRRVKMAAYFNELCVMVPTCNSLQRKPDKLTILRMASSHMRNLRGNHSNSMSNDCAYKPSFLTDQELKHLILEAADGFLFVSQCDTGNIIYVSDAVQSVLAYNPNDWTHRSLLDFVHPDDLDKVRDQLSTQENSSNSTTGRILDLKTGTVKKEGHPNSVRSHIGSRRSFVCRIRLGHNTPAPSHQRPLIDGSNLQGGSGGYWSTSGGNQRVNRTCLQSQQDSSDPSRSKYSVVHVTGYTKIWPPSTSPNNGANNQNQANPQQQAMYHGIDEHGNPTSGTNFHLIAIARIQMTSAPNDLVNSSNGEFVSRHDQNGTVTFVDQRVTNLLGCQPADMLKKTLCDYLVPQDQQMFKEQMKAIYETKQTQPVQMSLHFTAANGEVVPFSTSAYAFCNPCNDTFEFIVCTHTSQNYSEPKPNAQMSQLPNQMGTSPHHLDQQNNPQNYYNMHSLAQQQQQAQYPTGGYQQHADSTQQQLNYQSQFMTDSSQFGQGLNPNLMGQAGGPGQRPQINQNPNANASASAGYPHYLIMPNME